MTDQSLALDQFLDRLASGEQSAPTAGNDSLERTAKWLRTAAPTPAPDPAFAAALRSALLAGSVPSQARATNAEIDAAPLSLPPLPLRRRWVYAEVAAIVLILLPALWLLTRPDISTGPGTTELDGAIAYGALSSPVSGAFVGVGIQNVQLRTGPSFDAPSIMQLPQGTKVTVIDLPALGLPPSADHFAWCEAPDGTRGWVWIGALWFDEAAQETEVARATEATKPESQRAAPDYPADADRWVLTPTATPPRTFANRTTVAAVRTTFLQAEPGPYGYVIRTLEPGTKLWTGESAIGTSNATWLAVDLLGSNLYGWINVADIETVDSEHTPTATAIPEVTVITPVPTSTENSLPPTVAIVVPPAESGIKQGMVMSVKSAVYLRSEPRPNASVVKTLNPTVMLEVTGNPVIDETTTRWIPVIETTTGAKGWVPSEYVQLSLLDGQLLKPGAYVLTNERVNFRAEPSYQADIIVSLEPGLALLVIGPAVESDGYCWIEVRNPATGQEGWVASDFVDPVTTPVAVIVTATSTGSTTPQSKD